jgi:hypothetical protein
MQINPAQYTYITTNTTTQVATDPCILEAIVVNTTAAGTIGIIDGTTGTTVNVGSIVASITPGRYEYGIAMGAGIRIVTAAASDITIIWSR